ncbi:zinc finger protein 27-like [Folsomia candida]|uniref:zinc finger protein 27-like n=1 Tax=Folsomia candida TaxID=158441 RepID=UPI000B8F8AAE|nr:zinc finger protein 27-like [Folsomia candida]
MEGSQKPLDLPTDIGNRFHENGRLPPSHSVQPRPTPRDDNHVQSPSANSRSSKVKKLPEVGTEKIPCKICLCPFANATSAHLHAHTHFNPHELEQSSIFHAKCPHCDKAFFIRRDFVDHVAAHDGQKNYTCPVCRQKFTQKTHLTGHLFVHLSREERAVMAQGWRHVCYFCSKPFQSLSRLAGKLDPASLRPFERRGACRSAARVAPRLLLLPKTIPKTIRSQSSSCDPHKGKAGREVSPLSKNVLLQTSPDLPWFPPKTKRSPS